MNLTKKYPVYVLVVLCAFLMVAQAEPFFDLSHSRYPEAITFLHERDVLNGYEDGTFRPAKSVTRAELTVLVMLEHTNRIFAPQSCFADVAVADWFSPYVCGARELGLITGYSDNRFAPTETVSYAEAITLITSAFALPVESAAKGEPWFLPYQKTAHHFTLMPVTSYNPREALTREGMAQLLYRAIVVTDAISMEYAVAGEGHLGDVDFVSLQPAPFFSEDALRRLAQIF
jgi:hypothetical protein